MFFNIATCPNWKKTKQGKKIEVTEASPTHDRLMSIGPTLPIFRQLSEGRTFFFWISQGLNWKENMVNVMTINHWLNRHRFPSLGHVCTCVYLCIHACVRLTWISCNSTDCNSPGLWIINTSLQEDWPMNRALRVLSSCTARWQNTFVKELLNHCLLRVDRKLLCKFPPLPPNNRCRPTLRGWIPFLPEDF